jgi:hypothetical protein
MSTPEPPFREAHLRSTPIPDLGLSIAGTRLEPVIAEFQKELESVGIRRLTPRFYLADEWGVDWPSPDGIAIPSYLARADLIEQHALREGFLEGVKRAEFLRYLRHEMGHFVSYCYELYKREDWTKAFGSITQPYREDYRPRPFDRRFVIHLPGFYAQKHPDEDWAETFAVWMTPGREWKNEYKGWEALAKLEYCERVMAEVKDRDPATPTGLEGGDEGDDDDDDEEPLPPGLDGSLRSIFEDLGEPEDLTTTAPRLPAADLIRRLELDLVANVYRWTGHFPERTRPLLHHLAERAEQLQQVYPADRETQAATAITTLVTALAMNHVLHGSYMP